MFKCLLIPDCFFRTASSCSLKKWLADFICNSRRGNHFKCIDGMTAFCLFLFLLPRICLLHFSMERMKSDGLKSIKYEEPNIDLTPLFTKISVDIHELPWKDEWTKCAGPLMDAFRTGDDEPIDSEYARVPHPLKAAVARRNQPYLHSPVAQANKVRPNEPLDEKEIERREAVIRRRQEIEKERKENKRTGTAPYLEMEVL